MTSRAPNLQSEDLELAREIRANLPRKISRQMVLQYAQSKGIILTEMRCRKITLGVKDLWKADFDLALRKVAAEIRVNPSIEDFKRTVISLGLEDVFPPTFRHFLMLKEAFPEIVREVLTETNRVTLSISELDSGLLATCAECFDLSNAKTVEVLTRSLCLASFRGQVNLAEIVSKAKRMKPEEIAVIQKALQAFSLKNI